MSERQSVQQMVLGKLESCMLKKMKLDHSLIPYTKISPKCETKHYKTSWGKHRQDTLGHKSQQYVFDLYLRIMEIKTKINK